MAEPVGRVAFPTPSEAALLEAAELLVDLAHELEGQALALIAAASRTRAADRSESNEQARDARQDTLVDVDTEDLRRLCANARLAGRHMDPTEGTGQVDRAALSCFARLIDRTVLASHALDATRAAQAKAEAAVARALDLADAYEAQSVHIPASVLRRVLAGVFE